LLGLAVAAAVFASMFFLGRATASAHEKVSYDKQRAKEKNVTVVRSRSPRLLQISRPGSLADLITPPRPSSSSSSSSQSTPSHTNPSPPATTTTTCC
jgi:hypothetical protein